MKIEANTVEEYLNILPADRREAIERVRQLIRAHLPEGYEETIQYGMISYVVPLKLYPQGYLDNKEQPLAYVSLASQKNHMAVYMMCIYGNQSLASWFKDAYKATGKKLNMGKSCVRFKKLEDLPLEILGRAIASTSVDDFIAMYEKGRT